MVLAEDTRRSSLLFSSCGIAAKRFISLHDHNEKGRAPGIVQELQNGAVAALIADAGTPLVSDPGYHLVKNCRENGIAVSPVPGPSAPLAALSASGLPPLPFIFLGFPPRGKGDIRKFFTPYAALSATIIFFERKDRLASTLALASEVFGKREGCIARELTKTYEEFIPFVLDENIERILCERELLGEITVLLCPPFELPKTDEKEVLEKITEHKKADTSAKPKEIARRAQKEVLGWTVADIYMLLQR
jgi:16S rRNA (cytidine1402-2'-O)-methyltransferase